MLCTISVQLCCVKTCTIAAVPGILGERDFYANGYIILATYKYVLWMYGSRF